MLRAATRKDVASSSTHLWRRLSIVRATADFDEPCGSARLAQLRRVSCSATLPRGEQGYAAALRPTCRYLRTMVAADDGRHRLRTHALRFSRNVVYGRGADRHCRLRAPGVR